MILFYKYQGLGNDFVLIDNMEEKISLHDVLIRKLCDRRFGVGADGIILVEKSTKADARMVIYNSDGTHASMCGNASRCFAKYLYEKDIVKKTSMKVETDAGILEIQVRVCEGKVESAIVNMGKPLFSSALIPVDTDIENVIHYPIDVAGRRLHITSLFMGVPHTVLFEDYPEDDLVDSYVIEQGRLIENLPLFPQKTNVNFVKVISRKEIVIRTWERGAGYTLACGTGACASVAAGIVGGYLDEEVKVHLRGGDLLICWDGKKDKHSDVYMDGPAEEVFSGSIF